MKKTLLMISLAINLTVVPHAAAADKPSRPSKPEFPVLIGVLADSQITTSQGDFDYGMRRKYADKLTKVAIRPAAVEYLAPLMLDRLLLELEKQKVDLVLYLGDGANSGCKDELDTVFSILENSRLRSGIPSYYVVGNHDYLGAGNQTKISIRQKLCGNGRNSNVAETKLQVIDRISKHNLKSIELDKNFIYREKTSTYPQTRQCDGDDNTQFDTYHVGMLSNKQKSTTGMEILLLDTSDYRDVDFLATTTTNDGCEGVGVWGLKGSISYKKNKGGSQIDEVTKLIGSSTAYRLVASHYRPTNMNMIFPFKWSPSLVRDALGGLLSNGENIWVSGHTHTPTPVVESYPVGRTFSRKKGEFDGINVGSTTDYDPHAIILGSYKQQSNTRIGKSSLGYTKISYPKDFFNTCEKVKEFAQKNEGMLDEICGTHNYSTVLGLDQTYRSGCWNSKAVVTARMNIDLFASDASAKLGIDQSDVKVCLAYEATKNEYEGN